MFKVLVIAHEEKSAKLLISGVNHEYARETMCLERCMLPAGGQIPVVYSFIGNTENVELCRHLPAPKRDADVPV
jgi:hypothetical protein